jgi:hypothetical protein
MRDRSGKTPVTITADTIVAKYRALGYQKGWGFIACPEQRLHDAAVAIVGLNPGGGGADDAFAYGEMWDTPEGNAYFRQKWGKGGGETPIQGQVCAWHHVLGLSEDETLCAQFIPFRSPGLRPARQPGRGHRLRAGALGVGPRRVACHLVHHDGQARRMAHRRPARRAPGCPAADRVEAPDDRRL